MIALLGTLAGFGIGNFTGMWIYRRGMRGDPNWPRR